MVKSRHNHARGSFWPKLLLGSGIVLLIAAATTIVLVMVMPKNNSDTAQSASVVLDQFSKQEGPSLKNLGYSNVAAPYSTYLLYDDSRQYALYLPIMSGQYVKYQTKSSQTNSTKTAAELSSYVQKLGLDQINTTELNGVSLDLFSNDKVACQISDIDQVGSQPSAYVFACLNKSDISKEYQTIDSLLSKAQADISATSIKSITTQTITDADKKLLTVVTTNKNKSSSTLYYLNTGSSWSYVGVRPTPSVDNKNSFAMPNKLRQTIDHSSEKVFLDKYIH